MTTKTKKPKKETKPKEKDNVAEGKTLMHEIEKPSDVKSIAIGDEVTTGSNAGCDAVAIGSGSKEEAPKAEEVVIEDKDYHQFIKSVTRKAEREIRTHINQLDPDVIWELNKKDILAEIHAQSKMGRNMASFHGVIVPMGDTKIVLKTHDSYRGIIVGLGNMGFSANEKAHPMTGLYVSAVW